jgi:hypothetical protein
LEVQRDAQIEEDITFGNLKGADIFWLFEEAIKQMKRLQNPIMVDGDDGNDMENMEDIEHQSEDEDRVLTTMENNPSKKIKKIKIKKMLVEAMATHEKLAKNFFESNLKKKQHCLPIHIYNFGSVCDEQFIVSHI